MSEKIIQFIKSNPKTLLTLTGIGIVVYLMLVFQLDIRAITIITIVLGYITNVFAGLTALVGLIPIIGPLIVKVFTIPFFWILNGLGYFTSAYAIKKGYGKDVVTHRLIVFTLLTGIVLGYILGHLVPVR
ncbi:MAG: hypothetical protein QF472_06585 [Candidatus Marinimicrobia bacterium]|jgi:hypothetical protein|nr:hypothetical protein [Candidatus Neomarinimicrobiota bacterium]